MNKLIKRTVAALFSVSLFAVPSLATDHTPVERIMAGEFKQIYKIHVGKHNGGDIFVVSGMSPSGKRQEIFFKVDEAGKACHKQALIYQAYEIQGPVQTGPRVYDHLQIDLDGADGVANCALATASS